MQNLKSFINEQNQWNAFFGKPAMNVNRLTQSDIDDLARTIDSNASPENLHCDGEISPAEANRKFNRLLRVVKELELYCLRYQLNKPTFYEL
jgi:hypothetical protein